MCSLQTGEKVRAIMPIQDRNLTPGTALWAKYKKQLHIAEVVETAEGLRYRLADGREFRSPSAAGSAITGGNACNGWAFWNVGEAPPPSEATTPAGSTRATRTRETRSIHPVPKPQPTRKRSRRAERTRDATGAVEPIIERLDEQYECGECGAVFPTTAEASAHFHQVHDPATRDEPPAPEDPEPTPEEPPAEEATEPTA
jgi:hypothetical protein